MELDEYLSLIETPEKIQADAIPDLRAMLEYAPYCAATHLLLLKALHQTNNMHFEAELPKTVLYAPNAATLHALLYPPKKKQRKVRQQSGDYFEMLEKMEKVGRSTNESLQEIATRLKIARQQLQQGKEPISTMQNGKPSLEISEENARKCIKNKQYAQAIEILRNLNLNNPKKSIYFADQIRFLEKALNINS